MLNEVRGEEVVKNHVHFLGGWRIDAVAPRRDGRTVRRNRISKGSKEQVPKSVGDFENTSENPARTSPNWVMTADDVQLGPCKSNAISRMCGGKRFQVSRKLERWSALNRSSRVGEGERYVGWAKEASDSSHGGTVSSRRFLTKGSRHWWGQELIRVRGRSSNSARDSEVLRASGTRKRIRSWGVGQDGLQRHS